MFESQKYFEDYAIEYVTNPVTGKVKKTRVYVGDLYKLDVGDLEWSRLKFRVLVLYLTLAGSCIGAMLLNISANTVSWFSIPAILTMLLFCYGLRGVIFLITAEREMSSYNHRQIEDSIYTSSFFLRFTTGATAALGLVGLIMYAIVKAESIWLWLIYILLQIVGFYLARLTYKTSKGWYFICVRSKEENEEQKQ